MNLSSDISSTAEDKLIVSEALINVLPKINAFNTEISKTTERNFIRAHDLPEVQDRNYPRRALQFVHSDPQPIAFDHSLGEGFLITGIPQSVPREGLGNLFCIINNEGEYIQLNNFFSKILRK